jgi:uncharacterized protein (UPF0147 family)
MKALLRVKLDVSLPSHSEGVDEEQETRQLDKAARTAAAASSSGVLDDMHRDPSPMSRRTELSDIINSQYQSCAPQLTQR